MSSKKEEESGTQPFEQIQAKGLEGASGSDSAAEADEIAFEDPFRDSKDPLSDLVRHATTQPRSQPPRGTHLWHPVIRVDSASLYPTCHVLQGRFSSSTLIYEGPIGGRTERGVYSEPSGLVQINPQLIVSPKIAELMTPGCISDLKTARAEHRKAQTPSTVRRLEACVRIVESAGSVLFLGTDAYGSPRTLVREEDTSDVVSLQAAWLHRHYDTKTSVIYPPNNAITEATRRTWLRTYSLESRSDSPPWWKAFESKGSSFSFAFFHEPTSILSIDAMAMEDGVSEMRRSITPAEVSDHLLAGHACYPANDRDSDGSRLITLDLVSAIHFDDVVPYPNRQSGGLPDSFWK